MAKSIEEYILEFVIIHNGYYTYNKLSYVNSSTPMEIICPKHGSFFQKPSNHKSGKGCPKCNRGINDNASFIEESNNIHNFKYDYSKVNYIKSKDAVEIICPEHGSFFQKPFNHLQGKGCSKCSKYTIKTKEYYLERIKFLHPTLIFDIEHFNNIIEINTLSKIRFKCSIHLNFEEKTLQKLLINKGCRICSQHELISCEEAKSIIKWSPHKILWDKYIKFSDKIEIVCGIHGIFRRSLGAYMRSGYKCTRCSYSTPTTKSISYEDRIKYFNEIHNNKYKYPIFDNLLAQNKIEIICPNHGSFFQTINSHNSGNGCPQCNQSKGEKLIMNFLIQNNIEYVSEKKFINCINPKTLRSLRYDFFLPKYNYCIEFDGIHHFENIQNRSNLEEVQYRDNIKNTYCLINGINLIRFNYKESASEIIEKLNIIIGLKNDRTTSS